ncbi:MAG: hypothetical protein M1838_005611 [Thelocarpon superellum]|nr:MAG: hypothetical protein M1838_005611 [Thelocarpon superellum]
MSKPKSKLLRPTLPRSSMSLPSVVFQSSSACPQKGGRSSGRDASALLSRFALGKDDARYTTEQTPLSSSPIAVSSESTYPATLNVSKERSDASLSHSNSYSSSDEYFSFPDFDQLYERNEDTSESVPDR